MTANNANEKKRKSVKYDEETLTMSRMRRMLAPHDSATRVRIATWLLAIAPLAEAPAPPDPTDPRQAGLFDA